MARKDWIEKLTPGHFEHGEEFDREGNEVLPCQYDTYELAFQANIPPATASTPAQTPPTQTVPIGTTMKITNIDRTRNTSMLFVSRMLERAGHCIHIAVDVLYK